MLFGGNAVATHDIESALYGTSLGVASTAASRPGGHEHHLRAINRVASGRLDRRRVEQGS